jgi:ABC-2 type transport system permease protein
MTTTTIDPATIRRMRTGRRTEITPIPLSRVIRVELRKMFDTRSGFWLISSIAITGLLATIATIAFAPDDQLTYYNFAKAVGYPITIILPMVALLSITSEWSQRSGLWPSRRCCSPSPRERSETSRAASSPAYRRSGTSRSTTP